MDVAKFENPRFWGRMGLGRRGAGGLWEAAAKGCLRAVVLEGALPLVVFEAILTPKAIRNSSSQSRHVMYLRKWITNKINTYSISGSSCTYPFGNTVPSRNFSPTSLPSAGQSGLQATAGWTAGVEGSITLAAVTESGSQIAYLQSGKPEQEKNHRVLKIHQHTSYIVMFKAYTKKPKQSTNLFDDWMLFTIVVLLKSCEAFCRMMTSLPQEGQGRSFW